MTLPTWWLSAPAINPQSDPSIWSSLQSRLDVAKWRPARADGIVTRELRDRAGAYYVLKNPHTHTYMRLSPREYWVWQALDGARTVQELVVAYFNEYKSFAYALIVGLIQQLFEKQMLRDAPRFIFSNAQRELEQRTLLRKLLDPERGILTRQFLIARFDDLIARLYRAGAWILFTPFVFFLFAAVALEGSLLYLKILGDLSIQFTADRPTITFIWLYFAAIIPVVFHELAHAFTIKHYRREVNHGGIALYFGLPAAFVDTTDIWLESKRPRVAVALAGPFASIVVASISTLWLSFSRDAEYAPILFQLATLGFAISLLNLNPALKLDGYYVLCDALEMPNLRERSLAFFRHKLIPKFFRRDHWSRDEIIFLGYGALTSTWIGYSALLVWIAYHNRLAPYVKNLSDTLVREIRIAAISLLVLLALLTIILLRQKIFAMARRVSAQLARIELLARPRPLALAMLLVAIPITLVPPVLIPELYEWVDTIVGSVAIAFALHGAVRIAQDMRGTLSARAWQTVALAMGLAGAAHIFWGLRSDTFDPIAITLDGSAFVLTTFAGIFSARLLLGLRGSWRAAAIALLGVGWLGLLAPLAFRNYFPGVALHMLPIFLWLGGILHWQMIPSLALVVHAPLHATTTNEQMHKGFQTLVENLLAQLRTSFGTQNAARLSSRFNARARERDWGMTIADDNLDFKLPENISTADLADLMAAALSSLLYGFAQSVGENFTRAALARAHDALTWDEREVITENVLPQTRYAEGLAELFAQARQDSAELLARAPLFIDFTREELRAIGQQLRMEYFARGEIIIHEGDVGDRFYIIRRGRVQVTQRDAQGFERVVNLLESGDYFGEAALLTGARRNATVRATTSVSTFTLSKKAFEQLVRAGFRGRDKMDAVAQRVSRLRRIPIFGDFDLFELRRVAGQLETRHVSAGEIIFNQGDLGDKFYIIEAGQVSVQMRMANGEVIEQNRLGAGEYFGETALMTGAPRNATIIALEPCDLLALGADAFNALVQQSQSVSRALERMSSRRILLSTRGSTPAESEATS